MDIRWWFKLFLELHKLVFRKAQIHLQLQFLCRTARQKSPAFYSNYGVILCRLRLRDIAPYWSKIAKFLYPNLAPRRGWPRRNLANMFDTLKLEWLGYWINYDDMLSRFDRIPERDGRTNGRTDRIVVSISRVSVQTRDKNGCDYRHETCTIHGQWFQYIFSYFIFQYHILRSIGFTWWPWKVILS